jgi:SAM-dependent methyltransferase
MTCTFVRPKPWFEEWFDTADYHRLYSTHDEREAAEFVDALVERLRPAPGAAMLDLGCGAGRHSRALATRGFAVTGMDLAGESIRAARRQRTAGATFLRHDMRVPFGHERFDHVFSFFTSFGYFETEEENQRIVRNMFDALRDCGTLVVDYLNVAWSERRSVPAETREIDGRRYRISRWSTPGHFFKRIEIVDRSGKVKHVHFEQVAKLRLADFERMLSARGFEIESVFGDYRLGAYDAENSPRLVIVARKRAAALRAA